MSARTRAGGAAIGVVLYLYLGWLGWKDVLVAPRPELDPAAALAAEPGGPDGVGERATAPLPPPRDRVLAGWAASSTALGASDPGVVLAAEPIGSPARQPGTFDPRSEAAGPVDGRPGEKRVPDAPGTSAGSAVEEPGPADQPAPPPRLGGWVRDREGNAVAGLRVEAMPRRLFAGADAAAPPGAMRGATDGAGHFAFEPVPDGEYEVSTEETDRYQKAAASLRAGMDSAVLVVESKSGRTLHVHGVVESARGGPLKGVRVEAVGRPAPAAVSDDAGAYDVRLSAPTGDRDIALRFSREGYRDQRVAIAAAEAAGAEDLARDVRLEPTGSLSPVSGLVTGSDGPPVPRAAVQLQSVRLGRRYQAATDAGGRFTFPGVEAADDYRLWVHVAGYRDHVREKVAIAGQPATLDVVLDPVGTASLRGSMVDPDGRPLPGFTLWLRSAYGSNKPQAVTGDAQGQFAVASLPEGAVALETRAAPQISVSGIQIVAGPPKAVTLPLDFGPHRLEGAVVDEEGTPIGGARVSLHWSRADGGVDSRSFRETVTGANGSFLFAQLGSGVHTLNVTAARFRGVQLQPRVGPAAEPLRIELMSDQQSPMP